MTYIHKEIYGQGDPVVMLHGWAMHGGLWGDFAAQLAVDRQVICLDLPGHGRSESVKPYSLEVVVDALERALPDEPCSLVGWSLGGELALRLAEKYPHKVKSLILIASNPHFLNAQGWVGVTPNVLIEFAHNIQSNASMTVLRFMSLQVQGMLNMKPCLQQIKEALQECAMPELDVLMGGLQILETTDLRGALTALVLPVQMIFGERDSLVPAVVAGQCMSIAPKTDIHLIKGAGHVPFVTHKQQVLALVQDFLLRSEGR
ncbi:MAG: pimeloyl-ACP methyl ester esterase BioH [Methylococcaceae bacterium]|nr:pimeloyl-ACP methyl ester esterase BioH [Methylococcaceae bacterium]